MNSGEEKKKILPPLLLGIEVATFQSRVQHSTNTLSWLPFGAWIMLEEIEREKENFFLSFFSFFAVVF